MAEQEPGNLWLFGGAPQAGDGATKDQGAERRQGSQDVGEPDVPDSADGSAGHPESRLTIDHDDLPDPSKDASRLQSSPETVEAPPWQRPSGPVAEIRPVNSAAQPPIPRRRPMPLLIAVLALGLALGGGAVWFVGRPGHATEVVAPETTQTTATQPTAESSQPRAGSAAATTPSSSSTTVSARSTPSAPPATSRTLGAAEQRKRANAAKQHAAHRELERLADNGIAGVSLDGQDVAMIASKWAGIRDPLQTTASGGHVFQYSDILDEYQRLANGDNFGASVVMLRSTDYGRGTTSPDGKVLYVTFATGFRTPSAVRSWCTLRFSDLSKKQRADSCVPTQLTE